MNQLWTIMHFFIKQLTLFFYNSKGLKLAVSVGERQRRNLTLADEGLLN